MKSSSKNNILLGSIVLALFICYKLAIQKTIVFRNEYQELVTETSSVKEIPRQLAVLKKKEKYYDSILQNMDLEDTSLQNNLLRVLNEEVLLNNLDIIDFNQPHIHQNELNETHTFTFKLKGEFVDILKTIHALEQKGNFGKIVHLDFVKKKNYRTNKYSLSASVFLQIIK